jgi:threonine aldolase
MRQVGVLAAAGLVALRDMVGRLKVDHANARLMAGNAKEFISLDEIECAAHTLFIVLAG